MSHLQFVSVALVSPRPTLTCQHGGTKVVQLGYLQFPPFALTFWANIGSGSVLSIEHQTQISVQKLKTSSLTQPSVAEIFRLARSRGHEESLPQVLRSPLSTPL